MDRRIRPSLTALTAAALVCTGASAWAAAPFSCGGFAQLGGAQLLCSHVGPSAPVQVCTYSWTLAGAGGAPTVVQGSFRLEPGQTNVTVYQGSGYGYALANPVVLCQARKTGL